MKQEWTGQCGVKGFGFKPSKLPPETAARWAVEKHREYLNNRTYSKLMQLLAGKNIPCKIVSFLYGNADARIGELMDLPGAKSKSMGALQKTRERLNNLFFRERIPLKVVKERGNKKHRDRVWLDVCT